MTGTSSNLNSVFVSVPSFRVELISPFSRAHAHDLNEHASLSRCPYLVRKLPSSCISESKRNGNGGGVEYNLYKYGSTWQGYRVRVPGIQHTGSIKVQYCTARFS